MVSAQDKNPKPPLRKLLASCVRISIYKKKKNLLLLQQLNRHVFNRSSASYSKSKILKGDTG